MIGRIKELYLSGTILVSFVACLNRSLYTCMPTWCTQARASCPQILPEAMRRLYRGAQALYTILYLPALFTQTWSICFSESSSSGFGWDRGSSRCSRPSLSFQSSCWRSSIWPGSSLCPSRHSSTQWSYSRWKSRGRRSMRTHIHYISPNLLRRYRRSPHLDYQYKAGGEPAENRPDFVPGCPFWITESKLFYRLHHLLENKA